MVSERESTNTLELVVAGVVLAATLIVAASQLAPTIADPDIWGHVLNGLDILDEGAPITVDTYSYLSENEWINHHWLSNAVMGWLYEVGSSRALGVGKAFLAMLVVAVLAWRLVKLKVPMVRVALVTLAAVVLLTPTLGTFRPQVFTVVLTMTLFLVMAAVEKGKTLALLLLPPMFLAWANLHGGFFAGLVILTVWTASHLIPKSAPNRWSIGLWWAGAVAASMINPYGWGLHRFLLSTATGSRPEIQDWQSIDLSSVVGVVYVLFVALVVAAVWTDRREINWHLFVVYTPLFAAPLFAWRHLQFVPLAGILLAGDHLATMLRRRAATEELPERAVAALLAMAILITSASVALRGSCIEVVAEQFEFPQRAVAGLEAVDARGNGVVPFNWGEYVRWQLGPDFQVSTDGRRETVYSDDIHSANLDFMAGEGDWQRLLRLAPADWIVVPSGFPVTSLLADEPTWHIVYEDPLATVFVPSVAGDHAVPVDLTLPIDGAGSCFPAGVDRSA